MKIRYENTLRTDIRRAGDSFDHHGSESRYRSDLDRASDTYHESIRRLEDD